MRRRRVQGFTLIELLTVIVIIAILAAIFVPHWQIAIERADLTGCQSNVKNIATATQMYCNDNNNQPPAALSQLLPNYISIIPTCPSTQADQYTNGYDPGVAPEFGFTIYCNGANHTDLGYGPNQPFDQSGDLGP